jgi:putative ABC transport system substrate-binding protein
MRRREFIAALGGAAAWPLATRAQQPAKIPRTGGLWHTGNEQQAAIFLGGLRQGLKDFGYIEGKTIELLNRFVDEHYDRFDGLAAELVEAKVDIIAASVGLAALAAKRATTTIPVVFVVAGDPVSSHLVDSLAHPGGNLTGLSIQFTELTGKHLELLKDCLHDLLSVVLLYNPNSLAARLVVTDAQSASRSLNVGLSLVEARAPDELQQAFLLIAQRHPDAVLIGIDPMLHNERRRIAELAVRHRLSTIGPASEMAEAGLLMTYGPDVFEMWRRSAIYVDKILKGAKPEDLPVEQPTKFKLTINARTAHEVGVTIPPSLLARADEVIE